MLPVNRSGGECMGFPEVDVVVVGLYSVGDTTKFLLGKNPTVSNSLISITHLHRPSKISEKYNIE